ncbi:MAG: VWA domain-containing protein [Micrococcales bacterium]|nr:VWA domain-containing protein [Micrococcales bacterium]
MHINAVLDLDVVALEEDDSVTVMLEFAAPEQVQDAERSPHTAVIVLDRSGSMAGERLASAKGALTSLIDRLDDSDHFGLVVFDDEAQVAVPTNTVDALGRPAVKHVIAAIGPGGTTDLSSGYLRGLQEVRRVGTAGTLLVLSDGHANTGITDPSVFRQMAAGAAAEAITTSSVGIGLDYDDLILSEMAIGGTGNHSFAEEADSAAAAVAGEIAGLLSKTVQAGSLLIKPTQDVVSIALLSDVPSQGLADGVLVELGDFYSGEQRRLLVTLGVPAMAALGLAQVAQLHLNYVSVPDLQAHTVTIPVSVNVVPGDVAKGRVPDPVVQREKLLLGAQSAKRSSEQALRRGDVESARAAMRLSLDDLTAALAHSPSPEIDEEVGFTEHSLQELDLREATYMSRRLSSDRAKKARGYRGRAQGGQVPEDESR